MWVAGEDFGKGVEFWIWQNAAEFSCGHEDACGSVINQRAAFFACEAFAYDVGAFDHFADDAFFGGDEDDLTSSDEAADRSLGEAGFCFRGAL